MNKVFKSLSFLIAFLFLGLTLQAADSLLKGTALQLKPASLPTKGINGELRIDGSNVLKKYDTGAGAWQSITGGGSGVDTMGTFGSAPDAKGASISGTTLTMQPADSTHPGEVTATGTQHFGGNKIVDGNLGVSAIASFSPIPQIEAAVESADSVVSATVYRSSTGSLGKFVTKKARGTFASPSAILSGYRLGSFGGEGYGATAFGTGTTAGAVPLGIAAGMIPTASENWSDSAQGAKIDFWTTPTGSVNPAIAATMNSDGSFSAAAGITGTQLTSTVSTGTAPLVVSSTTQVANLNVAQSGKTTNLIGGNNTTLLGSLPYQSNTDTTTLLSPNTTTTNKFLTMTGSGTNGAAPAWGTIAASDLSSIYAVSAVKTTTYSILTTDNVVLVDGTSAFTATLPTAVGVTGKVYTIKRVDQTLANAVTIATTSSQTIDGATTRKLMTQYEQFTVVSDGSNWRVISHSYPSAWTSYTPTIVGFGTPTNVSALWKRVGDSVVINGRFSSGTSTAVTASFSLPSGITVNQTTLSSDRSLCKFNTNSTTTNGFCFAGVNDSGALNFSIEAGINYNNGNAIAASGGTVLLFSTEIPITSWEP